MAKEQGLKTLGDYRRIAKQTLFTPLLPIYGKTIPQSTSIYDAVSEALRNIYVLIAESRMNKSEVEQWGVLCLPGTKYEMSNEPLFRCVKLMELALYYNIHSKAKDKVFQSWPKRPDKDITVFTSVGLSYLEAAFDYVEERGREIIYALKDVYRRHNDAGRIDYINPFAFLNKTPEVDKLVFMPNPNDTAKAWYNQILDCLRTHFPAREYTSSILEKEFKTIYKQLEYEFDVWKNREPKPSIINMVKEVIDENKELINHPTKVLVEVNKKFKSSGYSFTTTLNTVKTTLYRLKKEEK